MVAVRRRAAEAEGAEGSGAFLGVSASVRGLAWRERLTPAGRGAAVAISQRHGLPEVLGRVLAGRGVGIDEVPLVLEPTIKAMMPNPSVLRDMDRAACRLADAIQLRQTIAVFGDYDVDGAASSALLERYLAHHGLAARIYIPDRLAEGYGPNVEALQRLFGDGAQLIVTVDCGTTSFEPLAAARRLGADVVVIDHHQADEHLPEACAIVNPNRQDDLSGLGYLCAAGLTFMVLVAVTRELRARGLYGQRLPEPNLLQLLDLVALATVCDMVPLTGLNRAYVSRGLAVMASRRNVGLRALLDAAGTNQAPTPYTLGFILGPRINAGGRIGNAALGARLLAIDDETEAVRIAVTLDRLNRERKAIEAEMLAEAVAMAERQLEADAGTPLLLVGSQDWHKGVVGLVASRLVERFGRPACAIAWEREEGTGSLRSVCGVDIGSAVRAAVARGLLAKGGGHAMAAGLTVERGRFEEAGAFLRETLRLPADVARAAAGLDIDGALTPQGVGEELVDLLERAGPYGQGNPQPRFAFPALRVRYAKLVSDAHVRCVLEASDGSKLDAVAFRAAGQPLGELLLANSGMPIHIAGSLKRDSWGGRQKIEVLIDDAADPRRQR